MSRSDLDTGSDAAAFLFDPPDRKTRHLLGLDNQLV